MSNLTIEDVFRQLSERHGPEIIQEVYQRASRNLIHRINDAGASPNPDQGLWATAVRFAEADLKRQRSEAGASNR